MRADIGDEQMTAHVKEQPAGHGPFSHSDFLLAALADRLDRVWFAVLRAGGGKPDMPEPLPRPGLPAGRRRGATPQQVAYMEAIRQQHRAARAAAGLPPTRPDQ